MDVSLSSEITSRKPSFEKVEFEEGESNNGFEDVENHMVFSISGVPNQNAQLQENNKNSVHDNTRMDYMSVGRKRTY